MSTMLGRAPAPVYGGGALGVRPGRSRVSGGTRTWLTQPDPKMNTKPREVMIPSGKCVYFWLGCESKRYLRNFCWHHYQEAKALGDLAPIEHPPAQPCARCKVRLARGPRSKFCNRCRKLNWRDANREHYREYSRTYSAKVRQRNAGTQDGSSQKVEQAA